MLGSYLIAAKPAPSGGMLAMVVAFGLMVPGQWWLHRYYAATVGRQVPAPRNPWPNRVQCRRHPPRPHAVDPVFTAGLSFVPIGLLDHWLLVRLMADARGVYLQDARLDSPSSGGRGSS